MKMIILSIILSSGVGALVGFGCMVFIDYSENGGGGVTELAGFAPGELNALEAQVSTAHAAWAQVYWLKRATLAIEQRNSTQVELGDFMQGVADILSAQKNSVELEPQVYLPHTPEP